MRHAEHAHAQPPDRAGNAVAVKIERRECRRLDIGDDVHLHAVDDGEKILALQIEFVSDLGEPAPMRRCSAGADRIDIGAPLLELRETRLARAGIVRNVVDQRGKTNRSRTSPRAAHAA